MLRTATPHPTKVANIEHRAEQTRTKFSEYRAAQEGEIISITSRLRALDSEVSLCIERDQGTQISICPDAGCSKNGNTPYISLRPYIYAGLQRSPSFFLILPLLPTLLSFS